MSPPSTIQYLVVVYLRCCAVWQKQTPAQIGFEQTDRWRFWIVLTILFVHRLMCADRQISQSEVSPAFAARVKKLRHLLATDLLAKPHSFGNEAIVGGEMLSSLLTGVCEAVNGGLSDFLPLRWVANVRLCLRSFRGFVFVGMCILAAQHVLLVVDPVCTAFELTL